jgi:hypothetical protein
MGIPPRLPFALQMESSPPFQGGKLVSKVNNSPPRIGGAPRHPL